MSQGLHCQDHVHLAQSGGHPLAWPVSCATRMAPVTVATGCRAVIWRLCFEVFVDVPSFGGLVLKKSQCAIVCRLCSENILLCNGPVLENLSVQSSGISVLKKSQ